MFHDTMTEHDKIEKNIIQIKKISIDMQKVFQETKTPESHHEWIDYCSKLMAEEEKLRENEKEIDNIKCVFRIECEET